MPENKYTFLSQPQREDGGGIRGTEEERKKKPEKPIGGSTEGRCAY